MFGSDLVNEMFFTRFLLSVIIMFLTVTVSTVVIKIKNVIISCICNIVL